MNSKELYLSIARELPPLFECAPAPEEGVRVRTPMLYPDGSIVDVFVLERDNGYTVTDLGEALGWLRMQSTNVQRSQRQQLLVQDTCQSLGLELFRGQLVMRSVANDQLAEAVLLVAQSVVKVSDIWFTVRSRALQTTSEEVDEWLQEKRIDFEKGVREVGRSGQTWTIDYRISTEERHTLVFVLTTGARGAVRRLTEHVLASCVDLNHLKKGQPNLAFVSLFDDTEDVWQQEDFNLVNEFSDIARWSQPDEFERILRKGGSPSVGT